MAHQSVVTSEFQIGLKEGAPIFLGRMANVTKRRHQSLKLPIIHAARLLFSSHNWVPSSPFK